MERGSVVFRPKPSARFRATKWIGLASLIPATGVALYLCFHGVTDALRAGSFDPLQAFVALLLGLGAIVGALYILVLLRIAPAVVYSNGLDVRDHFMVDVILGRTHHPWTDFRAAEVRHDVRPDGRVKVLVLKRTDGPNIAFDETDYRPEFLEAVEERLRTVPSVEFRTGA